MTQVQEDRMLKPPDGPLPGDREGDLCVELNKRIKTLIVSTDEYIVFLDEEYYVEWVIHKELKPPPEYSKIMNGVAYLETISTTHFADSTGKSQERELAEFRRLLGEAVARLFDGNAVAATDILDQAEKLLTDRSLQRARIWYLTAAACVAAAAAVCCLLLWCFRTQARAAFGPEAFDVLICSGLGGVGSLISIVMRVRDVNLNASAGRLLHYIEGGARVITGLLGAFLVALGIKANLIAGAVTRFEPSALSLACMGVFCFVAGASERLVPNLIRQIETRAEDSDKHDKTAAKDKQP